MTKKSPFTFKVGDLIVYPSHGVGRIVSVGQQEIHGTEIELISILIEEAKLTLRIPSDRAGRSGLRALADRPLAERALTLMKTRARGKSGTWNRRAQEYDKKVNSGDLLLAAEVVRDLRGKSASYSERLIYERALNRVCREIGQVLGKDPDLIKTEVDPAPTRAAA